MGLLTVSWGALYRELGLTELHYELRFVPRQPRR